MSSPVTVHALAALTLNGLALGSVMLAGTLAGEKFVARRERWIIGALAVGLAGDVVFWTGFWHPPIGRGLAWSALALAVATIIARRAAAKKILGEAAPVALGATLFVFAATALTLLYPRASVSDTATLRFLAWMPGDNTLPRVLAEIIDSGNPTRVLGGDWLTSDRPPLQTGVTLLTWPLLKMCGCDLDTACATAGIWFQALWFPTAWLLLRVLGLTARAAVGVTAVLGATGFFVFNTTYVWPKLGGAAFTMAAFLLWFFRSDGEEKSTARIVVGGACAGCAWLSHGGVMFSLLALVPFVIFELFRRKMWRAWKWAAVAFVVLTTPWLLYQKFYSPPGNRLVKWHIAGVIPPDARTVPQALRDRYREIGWSGVWNARKQNLQMLVLGNFGESFDWAADAASRRTNDIFFPLRTAAAWTLGLVALPWLAWRRRSELRGFVRAHALSLGWLVGGLVTWVALMFFPQQVFTHQGTLVTQVLLLCLLASWTWHASRVFFAIVAAVQCAGFWVTWVGPSTAPLVPLDPLAAGVAVGAGAALLAFAGWALVAQETHSNA